MALLIVCVRNGWPGSLTDINVFAHFVQGWKLTFIPSSPTNFLKLYVEGLATWPCTNWPRPKCNWFDTKVIGPGQIGWCQFPPHCFASTFVQEHLHLHLWSLALCHITNLQVAYFFIPHWMVYQSLSLSSDSKTCSTMLISFYWTCHFSVEATQANIPTDLF